MSAFHWICCWLLISILASFVPHFLTYSFFLLVSFIHSFFDVLLWLQPTNAIIHSHMHTVYNSCSFRCEQLSIEQTMFGISFNGPSVFIQLKCPFILSFIFSRIYSELNRKWDCFRNVPLTSSSLWNGFSLFVGTTNNWFFVIMDGWGDDWHELH